MSASERAQKACSICGVSFPRAEFDYGNRSNRSYCQACNSAERAAYAQGGREAARAFRDEKRSNLEENPHSLVNAAAGDEGHLSHIRLDSAL
jgi:hypothetical protein